MRVALYLRISTDRGQQDADNQRIQLRQFCEAQDWGIVQEYEDRESGGTSGRTQLQAMMRDAAQRRFDVLLFWSLDRLTREGALPTLQYLNTLSHYGVGFRSFTEPYLDSCGLFKDAIIAILGTIARQERLRLRERVKAGLERARVKGTRSGKPMGRPRVTFDRGRAAELRTQGWSWGRIAREMKVTVASARRAYQALGQGQQLCQKPQE